MANLFEQNFYSSTKKSYRPSFNDISLTEKYKEKEE